MGKSPTQEIVNLLAASKAVAERYFEQGLTSPDEVSFSIMAKKDRKKLAIELHEKGLSTREIAKLTGASQSTIMRDVNEPNGSANEPNGSDDGDAEPKKTTRELLSQSDQNDWRTPRKFLDAAREVLGAIDLDPATSAEANQTVEAATFYTEADDGLKQPWKGRVWLNPPSIITIWCEKPDGSDITHMRVWGITKPRSASTVETGSQKKSRLTMYTLKRRGRQEATPPKLPSVVSARPPRRATNTPHSFS